SGPHGPLGVILMRQRVAEVNQQAITEVLGDMPLIARNHLRTGPLIGPYYLPQFFRVELVSQTGGVDQITEQHGELATFGVGKVRHWSSRGGRAVCRRWRLVKRVVLRHHLRCADRRGRCWGTCPY